MSGVRQYPKRLAVELGHRTPEPPTPNSTPNIKCPGAPFKTIERSAPLQPRRLDFEPDAMRRFDELQDDSN
jgi:hypothetical protein